MTERQIAAAAGNMSWPAVCRHCETVHDSAKATVVQRYTDCTVWRCPGCGALIDDRPYAWGGSLNGADAVARRGGA